MDGGPRREEAHLQSVLLAVLAAALAVLGR